jgi:uncharacterized protein Yka (UPF0111/DUF47 family)
MSEHECTEHLYDEIQRLRESNFHLSKDCNELKQRIKRLEEAGDAMEYSTVVLESGEDLIEKLLIAQRAWRKAKEAKP